MRSPPPPDLQNHTTETKPPRKSTGDADQMHGIRESDISRVRLDCFEQLNAPEEGLFRCDATNKSARIYLHL